MSNNDNFIEDQLKDKKIRDMVDKFYSLDYMGRIRLIFHILKRYAEYKPDLFEIRDVKSGRVFNIFVDKDDLINAGVRKEDFPKLVDAVLTRIFENRELLLHMVGFTSIKYQTKIKFDLKTKLPDIDKIPDSVTKIYRDRMKYGKISSNEDLREFYKDVTEEWKKAGWKESKMNNQ